MGCQWHMMMTTCLVPRLVLRLDPQWKYSSINNSSSGLDEGAYNRLFIPFRLKQISTGSRWHVQQLLYCWSAGLLRQHVELSEWEWPQKINCCWDEMSSSTTAIQLYQVQQKKGVIFLHPPIFTSVLIDSMSSIYNNAEDLKTSWCCSTTAGTFGTGSSFECRPWYERSVVSAELFVCEMSIAAVVIKARQLNPI